LVDVHMAVHRNIFV